MKKVLENIMLDKKKIALAVLACVVVLYIDFSFFLKPQIQNTVNLGARIRQLKSDIGTLNNDLLSLQQMKKEYTELLSKTKKIINQEQLPILFKEISDMARKSNIKIMQLKPVKEGAEQEDASAQGNFMPVVLELNLTGPYHALGRFISNLESSEQFMAVQGLSISANTADYMKQKISLTIMTTVRK